MCNHCPKSSNIEVRKLVRCTYEKVINDQITKNIPYGKSANISIRPWRYPCFVVHQELRLNVRAWSQK